MATTDQDRELSVDYRGKNRVQNSIRYSHWYFPLKGVELKVDVVSIVSSLTDNERVVKWGGHFLSVLFFSAIFSIMPPINKAGIAQMPTAGKRKKKKNIKNGSSSSNISTSVVGVSVSIIAYQKGFR